MITHLILVVAVLAALAPSPAFCAQAITLSSLLQEMTDRDAQACFPQPFYACLQASSYDRATTNPAAPSWFANKDYEQFIRIEQNDGRREWVIMDHLGPGAITRFWLPLEPSRDRQVIRFYFDGSSTPEIAVPFNELLSGQGFVRPPLAFVSWNETDLRNQLKSPPKILRGVGGDLYLPIPFARACKVTLDQLPFYYIINFRAYEPGTAVQTFSMAAYQAVRTTVEQTGETLLATPDVQISAPGRRATLAPGQELPLGLPDGPGAVRNLRVQIDPKDAPQVLRSVVLLGQFDGEATIWCPIGEFFGAGARLNPVQDWFRTVKAEGELFARWLMPYQKSGRLTLKNLGTAPLAVGLAADSAPRKWNERSLLFHANWRCQAQIKSRPMSDWNYITIHGQGIYVGDTLTVYSPVAAWYGEGDERVYLEGQEKFAHNGTGTEDYYGYAWGMATYFNSPFISAPLRDQTSRGNWKGYTTTSRMRLLDQIPTKTAFKLDMEIWNWADTKVDYAVGTFWYARLGATHNSPPQPREANQPLAPAPGASRIAGAIECEKLKVLQKTDSLNVGYQDGYPFDEGSWSGDRQVFVQARQAGDFIELLLAENINGPRTITLHATRSYDYGILRFSINGRLVENLFDGYAPKPVLSGPIQLGTFTPIDGKFVLRVEVAGANPAAKGAKSFFGLDCVLLGTSSLN